MSARIDIARAMRLMARPVFPLRPALLQVAKEKRYKFDAVATALQGELGIGFRGIGNIMRNLKLWSLVTQACDLTAAIDQNHRGAHGKLRLQELALQSYVFEHRLLTLPQTWDEIVVPESRMPSVVESIDEITRVALMIYSAMVIFPSSPAARVKQRLSELLRTRLVMLSEHHDGSLSAYQDLLLWSLVVGGVACYDEPATRAWYVSQIIRYVSACDLSWEMVDAILHSFLYYDFVFEEPVAALWVQVARY